MDFRKVFTEISSKEYKSVGERIKAYENEGKRRLTPNTPVIINVDGQNFKKYASWFSEPFVDHISNAMMYATTMTCSVVQNVKVAYSYSDKATFIVVDPNDQMWFNGNDQEIASTVSSLFTYHFNAHMDKIYWGNFEHTEKWRWKPAMFRCNLFQVPIHEVNNVLVWKQRNAMRNAVSAMADAVLNKDEVKGKTPSTKLQMLIDNGHDVSLQSVRHRGFCAVKEYVVEDSDAIRRRQTAWGIDDDVPIFSQDKGFVDCILKIPEL